VLSNSSIYIYAGEWDISSYYIAKMRLAYYLIILVGVFQLPMQLRAFGIIEKNHQNNSVYIKAKISLPMYVFSLLVMGFYN
jgi:hypothetical protein